MDRATDHRFTTYLFEAADRSKAETGYDPTGLRAMLHTDGGYQTTMALLRPPVSNLSDGFRRLWQEKRLDLTVEALLLKPDWSRYFTNATLKMARDRLERAGYKIPVEPAGIPTAGHDAPTGAQQGDETVSADASSVWRVTGPPENFITALTRRFWAVNEKHERTWDRLQTGDVLILHSTQQSAYAKDGRSTIIGFARVGSQKYRKSGLWWIQEIEQSKNEWPFAFSLDAIVLFHDLSGRIDLSRPIEQKTRDQRIREATFLGQTGITVDQLNRLAKQRDSTFPNFPVNGSISHLHEVYIDLVVRAPSDGMFFIGEDDALPGIEQDLLSDEEKKAIDDAPLDKVRADAQAFKDSPDKQPEFGVRRIRRESVAQKRRVARLENFTCQVCAFHCEYRNSNGERRYVIHVDHIQEKAGGGGEELNNLWVLCPNCHAKKTFGVITIDLAKREVKEAGARITISDKHLFV